MKSLLLSLCLGLFAISTYAGADKINSEDFSAGTIAMEDAAYTTMTKAELKAAKKAEKQSLKAEKKQLRQEKRLAWANRVLEKHFAKSKSLGGLDDPIDKWLWYAIIAFGVSLIFWFIFWPVAWIFSIAALVFLILWIIKRSE